ncbi:MAG: hypothetical protein V4487_07945 [Chlamydiota bacterium]
MSKDLIKLAMIGLTAGLCVSATTSIPDGNGQVAMSKCSKDTLPPEADKDNGSGCSGSEGCGSQSSSNEDQSDASMMPAKRKSAAQKVVQGS